MCQVHFPLSTLYASCLLSSQYWEHIIFTFLSLQGMCHVHCPINTGHISYRIFSHTGHVSWPHSSQYRTLSLTTGYVSCPLSSQYRAHIMYSFLSVQGIHHFHSPLSKGHMSCPLLSHYRACVLSTVLSAQGTCQVHLQYRHSNTPQLNMTHVYLPL